MDKLKKRPIIILFLALAVLYVIIYIVPKVSGAMVSSYIAEYGQLRIYDETTAYFVRNENVYLADSTGEVNSFFEEGSLVRKNAKILEITGTASGDAEIDEKYLGITGRLGGEALTQADYRAADVGVVSYYADGYEREITPKTMEKKDYTFFSQLRQDDVISLQRKRVIAGEPLFKIVDRTEWFMVCFVDGDHIDRYEEGSSVKVEFEDGNIDTKVYKSEVIGDVAKVILRTDYYYERFSEMRVADVSLVTYDENGVIVENSSITEKKGQTGVYVKSKSDDFFFVPVEVYATDGKKSLIADDFYYDLENDGELVITVEVYDEILKDADDI